MTALFLPFPSDVVPGATLSATGGTAADGLPLAHLKDKRPGVVWRRTLGEATAVTLTADLAAAASVRAVWLEGHNLAPTDTVEFTRTFADTTSESSGALPAWPASLPADISALLRKHAYHVFDESEQLVTKIDAEITVNSGLAFVQAGVLMAGGVYKPSRRKAVAGSSVGVRDDSEVEMSAGGAEFVDPVPVRRRLTMVHRHSGFEEGVRDQMMRLLLRRHLQHPLAVVWNSQSPDVRLDGYYVLRDWGDMVPRTGLSGEDVPGLWELRLVFEEYL